MQEKGGLMSTTTLVSNGCVDIRGRIADKQTTGGWKAASYIIVNEVVERLAFYSIAVNMVSYFRRQMHQSLPDAVTHMTDWVGAAYVLTILGAFLADAYLGRFRTIIIFSCIYSVELNLLLKFLWKTENSVSMDSIELDNEHRKSDYPLMDDIQKYIENTTEKENGESTLVTNGSVDIDGNIADKRTTGGWKASPFVIANEVAERLAFFSIAVNMVSYLVREMHESLPDAATHVTDWIGAAFVLTILGAFLADAYLGRFRTIIIFSCIYAIGMVLLTVSASIDSLRPPPCVAKVCKSATGGQTAFLYIALGLIALGTGGIKPCVSSFGADQFDEADKKEVEKKFSFFNWFFFAINIGALLGITVIVYIQVEKGWIWGFGIPTAAMFCSIFVLAAGAPFYRYQKPMGSAFTRFVQVGVAAVKNHRRGVELTNDTYLYEVQTKESAIAGARKLPHTFQYRFLDKAAVIDDQEEANSTNSWRLCTVTQVEEFKCFIRVLPIWASTIALSISFAQLSTLFVSQAILMDRKLGPDFLIPTGSVPIFAAINALILVPIYEGLMVPILRRHTGHRRGITSLQRMGVGLFVSIFALMSAALVEKKRRNSPNLSEMSVFYLLPQYFLIGSAEVFTYVGQLEFFYDEATDGTRSISSAMFLSEIGIGSWLSTAIVKSVESATGGLEKGWLRNNLNKSKLDHFYWLLTGINAVNFLVFLFVSRRYKGKENSVNSVRDEVALVEKDDDMKSRIM